MIELANPALLSGLALAAAPLALHLVSRRRQRPVRWAAMRFLAAAMARHRRTIAVQERMLLAIRMLALACLALAVARPRWVETGGAGPDDDRRQGRAGIATVLAIDDSPSAAAAGGIEAMRALARAWLDRLRPGDEVSIVTLADRNLPATDPGFDLVAMRERVGRLSAGHLASDHADLLAAACGRLTRHLNPQTEVVLITDGRADGWMPDDRQRWNTLARRFAADGGRKPPSLIVLAPEVARIANGSIAACTIDREPVAVGVTAHAIVTVARSGGRSTANALVRLAVDGRAIAEQTVACAPDASATVPFPISFTGAGEHTVEATLATADDHLAADDSRALVVEVAERLPLLLVEGQPPVEGRTFSGSLGPLAAALTAGDAEHPLFQIERVNAGDADLVPRLERARAMVLGDVPALEPRAVAAIERAVAAGAGLLVVAGPRSDPGLADRLWWRHGDGFLAAPLVRREHCRPPRGIAGTVTGHAAVAGLPDGIAAGWEAVRISARACPPLPGEPGAPAGLERLLWCDDGRPLALQRPLGRGRTALLTCGLDGGDGDLPWRPVFVALMRSWCAHLAAHVRPSRNLPVDARAAWHIPDGAAIETATILVGPGGMRLPLERTDHEGRPSLMSPPLALPGLWSLSGVGSQVRFATTLPATESALVPTPPGMMAAALAGIPFQHHATAAAIAARTGDGGRQVLEWWPGLILAALALLLAEVWWTRRIADDETTRDREASP